MNEQLLDSMQVLFQKSHIEALINNQKQVSKWEVYKKDITDVQDRMKLFLQSLNVPILVPVGNKALFRGKLIHTNDILISLGDGYFTKGSVDQALEIISRRLIKCDDMLQKLETERQLLESRMNLRRDPDLFPTESSREIVEEFVDDEENIWKQEHRKKVKDYKQKLAKMKGDRPSEIKNDEDLWKRLEILEMEEELNDELDRLGEDVTDSSDDTADTESSDENTSEYVNSNSLNNYNQVSNQPSLNRTPGASILKRSQSPDDNSALQVEKTDNSDNEYIKIEFKHSSNKPNIIESDKNINSPYDVYTKFNEALNKNTATRHKKISRRVSFADLPQVKTFKCEESRSVEEHDQQVQNIPVAFGDIVERTEPVDQKMSNSRPVSKFKSSRNKLRTQ